MFLGQIFVKNTKNDPKTIFELQELPFWALKTAKLIRFSRYQIEIFRTFSSTSNLPYVFRFFEN